jgi:hypothetical protein
MQQSTRQQNAGKKVVYRNEDKAVQTEIIIALGDCP